VHGWCQPLQRAHILYTAGYEFTVVLHARTLAHAHGVRLAKVDHAQAALVAGLALVEDSVGGGWVGDPGPQAGGHAQALGGAGRVKGAALKASTCAVW
jgi:hypothetical protein